MAALLLALGSLGAAPPAPFGVQPQVATLSARTPIAELEFSSLYAQERIFDVRVLRWTQRNGQDVFTPDDGFVVSPSVFSIAPYESVLIRIEQRGFEQPSVEQSYKIVMTSVVAGAGAPPSTAPRLEATLFVPPAKPADDAIFTLKNTQAGQGDLIIENRGNAHLYLGNLSIDLGGRIMYSGTIAAYVLANSTRTFHLRVADPPAGAQGDVTFDDAQGQQHTSRLSVVP